MHHQQKKEKFNWPIIVTNLISIIQIIQHTSICRWQINKWKQNDCNRECDTCQKRDQEIPSLKGVVKGIQDIPQNKSQLGEEYQFFLYRFFSWSI